MAQKDSDTGPSLELPSLFGRRKRRAREAGGTTATTDAPAPEPTAEQEPVEREPAPREAEPQEPASAAQTPPEESPTAPVAAAPAVTPTPVPAPSTDRAESTQPAEATPGGRRAWKGSRQAPDIGPAAAAFLVGAVVGLAGCALTFLSLQGCEVVTGVGSCGGPGLLVLLVILVVMVLGGAAALRWSRVSDAGNVSFLGVGMMTVVALLFLIDYLYDPWMFLVIPSVTALTFSVAHWVTTRYTDDILDDDDDGGMPHHDIR